MSGSSEAGDQQFGQTEIVVTCWVEEGQREKIWMSDRKTAEVTESEALATFLFTIFLTTFKAKHLNDQQIGYLEACFYL